MKPKRHLLRTSLLLASVISCNVNAASISWSGATDSVWSTNTNWTGNVAPVDTDTAVFNLTSYPNQPIALTTNLMAGLVFGDGSTATAPVEFLGDLLTIGAGGIDMKANAGAATLDTAITLGAAQTWLNNSTNPLTVAEINGAVGPITNGGFNLTVDGSGPVRLDRGMTGAGGIVKNGSGTLTLTGAHTYTGATNINAGTLEFGDGSSGTLPSAIANSTTLKSNSSTDLILSGVISGTGALVKEGTGMLTLSNSNTYSGATTINAGTLRLQRVGTTTSSNANTSGYTVNTGGTLDISTPGGNWNVAVTKPVSLNGGTLSLSPGGLHGKYALMNNPAAPVTADAASAITINAPGTNDVPPNHSNFFLDGGLKGSADVTVTSNTGGLAVVLRSVNSTYSGKMTINGIASAGSATGSGVAIDQTTVLGSADFVVNGTLEIGGGAGVAGMGWASSGTTGQTVQIDGLGGTGVVVSNMGAASSTRTLSIGNNGGGDDFAGVIANGTNNTLSLVKNGAGTQTLSGENTFSGTTTVNAGILRLNHQYALQNSVFDTASTGTLIFGSEEASNAFTLGGLSGPGNLVLVNSAAAPIDLDIGSTTSTYAGQLSGTGSLTKIGGGTFTLSGTSTYSGTTTVTAGQLNVSGGLPNSNLSLESDGTLGGEGSAKSITLSGGTLRVDPTTASALTASNGLSITGPVDVTLSAPPSGPGAIVVMNYSGTFTGNLADFRSTDGRANFTNSAGAISMSFGAGSTRTWGGGDGFWENGGIGAYWVEGDQKFYSGDTVIFPDPAGPNLVTLSGTLQPASTTVTNSTGNDYTFSGGAIAGTGGLTKNGTGTLVLTAANTYSGGTIISGGTLQIGDGTLNGTANGTYSIGAAGTLHFNQGTTPAIPTWANISGAGTLRLSDAATSGSVNYTTALALPGTFTGTLRVDNRGRVQGTSFGGATNIILNNGAQFLANGANATIPQNFSISGFGSEASQNFGALRVAVNNITFTGAINLTGNAGFYLQSSAGGVMTVNGVISDGGSGYALALYNNNSTGTMTLGGANTFSGTATLQKGIIVVSSLGNAGNPGNLGTASTIDLGSTTNTTTLRYTGAGEISNRVINLAGTGGTVTLDQSGTGLFKFTSAMTATGAGSKALSLLGSTAGSGEIGGAIVENSGTNKTSVSKSGTGSWTLSGANAYTGTTTVSAGVLRFAKAASFYNSATGAVSAIDAAKLTVVSGATCALNVGGGTEFNAADIATMLTASTSTVGFKSGSTLGLDTTGGNFVCSTAINNPSAGANALGLTKSGANTLTLSATNSYSGSTSVNAGALLVTGTKSGAGTVTVAGTATLGGTGSIAGAVTVQSGGTLAPGVGAGNLSFTSTVNLASGSTYAAEIASASSNDKVTATGAFTVNGTVKVTLVGGYSPATGTVFDLADATIAPASTPTFDFSAAVLPAGLSWNTSSFATNGTISVTGTPSDLFSAWATTNSVIGGKGGDDDNDGVKNLMEFATAANPKNGSSGARAYPRVHIIGGQKVLTYTVATRAGATFVANGSKQQADKDNLRYVIEASDQFGTWNSVVVTELSPADASAVQAALSAQLGTLDSAWQWHSFRTDGDVTSDPGDFIRLNVTDIP